MHQAQAGIKKTIHLNRCGEANNSARRAHRYRPPLQRGPISSTAIPMMCRPCPPLPAAPPPPLLPLPSFRHSPAFPLPYPLRLYAPSLVAVVQRQHRSRIPAPLSPKLLWLQCPHCAEGALVTRRLYHASLWSVFCVTRVQHTRCGVLVSCLICTHGHVHSRCCAVVFTSSWPLMSVGRLRVTVLVRCVLCVHREGVPVDMWCARWRLHRFQRCASAVW